MSPAGKLQYRLRSSSATSTLAAMCDRFIVAGIPNLVPQGLHSGSPNRARP